MQWEPGSGKIEGRPVRHLILVLALLLVTSVAAFVVLQRPGRPPVSPPTAPLASVVSVASADVGLSDDEVFARSMARLAEAKRLAEAEAPVPTMAARTGATGPGPERPTPVLAHADAARPVEACEEPSIPGDVEVEYYPIRGATSAELRAQMRALGPCDEHGARHYADAHWRVRWRYPFQRTSGACATGPSKVTLTTTYLLPRWVDAALGPGEVQEQWKCFLAALLVHEDGHRLHGRDAAARIEVLLPTLPPQRTCPEMDALANAEAEKVLQHFRELDQEYDRSTRHGATQAVVLGDSVEEAGVCR